MARPAPIPHAFPRRQHFWSSQQPTYHLDTPVGPDGHCASLFPGRPLTMEEGPGARGLVAAETSSPKPPPARVTLTRRAIKSSRHVVFIAGGAAKAEVVAKILRKNEGGELERCEPTTDVPATLVEPSVSVGYFLDAEAADELGSGEPFAWIASMAKKPPTVEEIKEAKRQEIIKNLAAAKATGVVRNVGLGEIFE